MQVSNHKYGHAEKRSLENIQEDYDKVVADGCHKSTEVLSQSDPRETAGHWIGQSRIKQFILLLWRGTYRIPD